MKIFGAWQSWACAGVALIDKLSVVLVAIFGVLFLGERLSLLNTIGVGLIAVGAVMVAMGA
jgi:transporter family protein